MKVLKFGGSSVANAKNITKVVEIVTQQSKASDKTIVVVSAFQGITDLLIETARKASRRDESYKQLLLQLEEKHLTAIKELFAPTETSPVLSKVKSRINDLEAMCEGVYTLRELSPRILDAIISYGEELSSFIIARKFMQVTGHAAWADSRELIVTDSQFNKAQVYFEESNANIVAFFKQQPEQFFVMPGFIAANKEGAITTLGRGGSDYTAAIVAAALDVNCCEIWTDVSGMLTADPRLVPAAHIIPKVTYQEAMELSHFGAKVIYPPTLQPLMWKNIPVLIKNTFAPEDPGTIIDKTGAEQGWDFTGISGITKIALITLEGSGMIGIPGFSARFFSALAAEKINVVLITQGSSEHSICAAIEEQLLEKATAAVNKEFATEMAQQKLLPLAAETNQSIIALVGNKMKNHPGISGRMFTAFGRNGINVRVIAQGSSEMNISAVIHHHDLKKAMNVLHQAFFEKEVKQLNIFIAGAGNVGAKLLEMIYSQTALLQEKHIADIKVIGIASSRKMICHASGIDLSNWEQQLQSGSPSDLEAIFHFCKEANLPNTVFVDVTANEAVAVRYEELLAKSISVVACNKIACTLSLRYYQNLKRLAREFNAAFLYETNVGAALPVIKTLNDFIVTGDKVQKIEAVLSGSLNFIFSNYNALNTFQEVVKRAAAEGYTEPDPRIDLSGKDVARKILILARESGLALEPGDVEVNLFMPEKWFEGSVEDFYNKLATEEQYFKDLYHQAAAKNAKLKIVASLENGKTAVSLKSVTPDHEFYAIKEKDNAVLFYTERYSQQPMIIKGAGAGAAVTASGIFADILRTLN